MCSSAFAVRRDAGMSRRLLATPLAVWEREGVKAALIKAALPADDVNDPRVLLWRFETVEGIPVGFGGLEVFGSNALLRSLVTLPPLRERVADIPMLAHFFAQKFAQQMKKPIERIPAEAMAALTGYPWPGNIRELQNLIERAVILTRGRALEIPLAELKQPANSIAQETTQTAEAAEMMDQTKTGTLKDVEREHILRALSESNWVIGGPNGAATRLGLNRTTLNHRMRKLGITRPR